MKEKFIHKFAYTARNLQSRALFKELKKYCAGDVLDIGGWDFFLSIKNDLHFKSWTNLEISDKKLLKMNCAYYKPVVGNGENVEFSNDSFDTVLNVQVLEHTFEPIKMVQEIGRVLKRDGYGIFLIPQTSVMHAPPYHYYNFTRFWIQKVMPLAGLEIIQCRPLGGLWTTTASHLVHFFLKILKFPDYSTNDDKRNLPFFILLPFMIFYAVFSIPICLLFGLGDLVEDPNNWLVVVKK